MKVLATMDTRWFLSIAWSTVLFHLGRAFLLLATLGRFPRGRDRERHVNAITFAGALLLLLAWLLIALHNNRGAAPF